MRPTGYNSTTPFDQSTFFFSFFSWVWSQVLSFFLFFSWVQSQASPFFSFSFFLSSPGFSLGCSWFFFFFFFPFFSWIQSRVIFLLFFFFFFLSSFTGFEFLGSFFFPPFWFEFLGTRKEKKKNYTK